VVTGEPGQSFVMGWAKTLHFLAAIAFTIAVLSRILWMFVGRNVYSSWREFVPSSRARLEEAVDRVLFYSLIRRDGQDSVGHNPLAGAGYSGVFGLYLFMIVSGIGLYAMSADARSWMSIFGGVVWWIGGPQLARFLHHAVMWVLLVFFVQHLYFVLLATIGERNGTMDSIFSGYKWFRRDRK
jgi:Ni/Fe-hydrogenase 1 B-type cytochrome subunit